MSDLQYQVYAAVAARGYRDGWTPEEFVRRQFLKSVEELGECFRHLFDGRLPPAEEMADVIIPLLAAAEVMEMVSIPRSEFWWFRLRILMQGEWEGGFNSSVGILVV